MVSKLHKLIGYSLGLSLFVTLRSVPSAVSLGFFLEEGRSVVAIYVGLPSLYLLNALGCAFRLRIVRRICLG